MKDIAGIIVIGCEAFVVLVALSLGKLLPRLFWLKKKPSEKSPEVVTVVSVVKPSLQYHISISQLLGNPQPDALFTDKYGNKYLFVRSFDEDEDGSEFATFREIKNEANYLDEEKDFPRSEILEREFRNIDGPTVPNRRKNMRSTRPPP